MRVPTILASTTLAAMLLPAQANPPKGGNPGGAAGNPASGTGTPGAPPIGSLPTTPSSAGSTANPGLTKGAYYFGKVAMADGADPPVGVVIQRVCGSVVRPQAYADTRGNFSFQIGDTKAMLPDEADSSSGPQGQRAQANTTPLTGCELRASLAGYRSDVIQLSSKNIDDPNVGTIFLHPYFKIEGLTTSATSALAPKEARRAFDKGVEAAKKSKFDEALDNFLKATELYPRYASAWLELGRVYQQRSQVLEARNAYAKSIAADPKFINPYERLYVLSINEERWEDAAATTDRIMRLNPYDFPMAVYYNAVANLELGKLDVAEKSAREAAALGTASRNPKINYVLGVILAKKQDYKGAAECLREYLKSDTVGDRNRVTQLLADIEKQVRASN
jgi:tetratricopeptide (TPR) repeat protein